MVHCVLTYYVTTCLAPFLDHSVSQQHAAHSKLAKTWHFHRLGGEIEPLSGKTTA